MKGVLKTFFSKEVLNAKPLYWKKSQMGDSWAAQKVPTFLFLLTLFPTEIKKNAKPCFT